MISTSNTFKGGEGDDTVLVEAYGDVASGQENVADYAWGQAGNDVVRGTHKAGAQYLYGGDGEDKLYGGDGQTDANKVQIMSGNAGDDWLEGGDGFIGAQWIYGDTQRPGEFLLDEYDGELEFLQDSGDDVIYGGHNGQNRQTLAGGYGDDRIFSGSGASTGADTRIRIFGDMYRNPSPDIEEAARRGSPEDGDDLIDIGDNPDITGNGVQIKAFGQGGNDKILGSLGIAEELYGGDGDDKIWAENPGQVETVADVNTIFGGNGKDIIYGSVMRDRLYGDWQREDTDEDILNDDSSNPGKFDTEGDDDIIYTGVSTGTYEEGGDYVHGGWGNDKLYGQGESGHNLYGEFGDDMIWGSEGNDYIYGDDYS
jgi:Ca2+-binding RTX toxin-like protein